MNTMDLFTAMFIFIIILVVALTTWNKYTLKAGEKTEFYDMSVKAFQISDSLVKTRGYPENWTADNVKVLGLASNDRNLSLEKINSFTSLNLNKSKEILHLYGYNFYFELKTSAQNITYGMTPSGNKAISITRYALLNNEDATMRFSLWK